MPNPPPIAKQMLSPLEEVKVIAASVRQNAFWYYGQRLGCIVVEVALYIMATALLALDVYVIAQGHRLLVAEAVHGPTRTSAYLEDERITLVLSVGYLLLFLLALACVILARVLRDMRARHSKVQALCVAVAKL